MLRDTLRAIGASLVLAVAWKVTVTDAELVKILQLSRAVKRTDSDGINLNCEGREAAGTAVPHRFHLSALVLQTLAPSGKALHLGFNRSGPLLLSRG